MKKNKVTTKKLSNKKPSRSAAKYDSLKEKYIDDTFISAIRGLDLFIAQASSARLGTMAEILHTAKEELIYWAVKMNFHETAMDKFINGILYGNALFGAADFITACNNKNSRRKLAESLKNNNFLGLDYTLLDTLRSAANPTV